MKIRKIQVRNIYYVTDQYVISPYYINSLTSTHEHYVLLSRCITDPCSRPLLTVQECVIRQDYSQSTTCTIGIS